MRTPIAANVASVGAAGSPVITWVAPLLCSQRSQIPLFCWANWYIDCAKSPAIVRLQQGQQLDVRAVLVPAGEGPVLRSLPRREAVDLLVAAQVAAVDVVEDVRLQHRVVERGVEGGPLRVGCRR